MVAILKKQGFEAVPDNIMFLAGPLSHCTASYIIPGRRRFDGGLPLVNDHFTDEELIRLIDGELQGEEKHDPRIHCAECSACRFRYLRLEQAVSKGHFFSRSTTSRRNGKPGTRARN
jgi:hypothetical protein